MDKIIIHQQLKLCHLAVNQTLPAIKTQHVTTVYYYRSWPF